MGKAALVDLEAIVQWRMNALTASYVKTKFVPVNLPFRISIKIQDHVEAAIEAPVWMIWNALRTRTARYKNLALDIVSAMTLTLPAQMTFAGSLMVACVRRAPTVMIWLP